MKRRAAAPRKKRLRATVDALATLDDRASLDGRAGLAKALATWYPRVARDLPWRTRQTKEAGSRRDPWGALVSELMLQQTQVARVLEKFEPFMTRFATPRMLAEAAEHDVLALWSGLGYYRRARLLHACAKAIVERHAGRVPESVDALRALPGLGRYTAGAIASIVFGAATPIVDGNVARVLLRVSARQGVTAADAMEWAWDEAEDLVNAAAAAGVDVGVMNEAMMELGATVCTPRLPRCDACPIAALCRARADGTQESIPEPKRAAARRAITADVLVIRRGDRVLVRRRPARGMWAGLWEAPTRERPGTPEGSGNAADTLIADLGLTDAGLEPSLCALESGRPETAFLHKTTHRDVYFRVWRVTGERSRSVPKTKDESWRWVRLEELDGLGLSNPQAGILRAALG